MDVGHFMATDGATCASIEITSVEMPNDKIDSNILDGNGWNLSEKKYWIFFY